MSPCRWPRRHKWSPWVSFRLPRHESVYLQQRTCQTCGLVKERHL